MAAETIPLASALDEARTGDLWLFTGHSIADQAIRIATNSPVNHVGMVIAVDDLPPLLWHAELGRSLVDVWSGEHRRGAQLHRLDSAVRRWVHKYRQTPFVRHLEPGATRGMEDAALSVVADFDGNSFPSTVGLASRWLQGRVHRSAGVEKMFCAEVVALTYQAMGLLDDRRPINWYDPGRFWSGDHLDLVNGAELSSEARVDVPAEPAT